MGVAGAVVAEEQSCWAGWGARRPGEWVVGFGCGGGWKAGPREALVAFSGASLLCVVAFYAMLNEQGV